MEDKNAIAKNALDDIKVTAFKITNSDLNRLSAVSTNICPIMRAVQKLFYELPELAYIFGVGCDSYGQQLVVKDIVDPRVINKVKISLEIYNFQLDLQSIIKQFSKKNTL